MVETISSRPTRSSSLQVTNAITRQKKEEIVSTIRDNLKDSVIVFGMRFQGIDVPTMQKFRKGLPESTNVFVCKNTLMRVATEIEEAGQWQLLGKDTEGDNCWVFVDENSIQDTVKHYFKFEEELFTQAKRNAAKGQEVKPPTSLTTVVMDNKLLTPQELKACEKIPTKKQLLATIASLAKQPATKVATGIKQVPTKLAVAIKQISELDEDKTKIVGSLDLPKKDA
mmetsp:Transcript_22833/g.63111  ORF Transcript_22833/g.63111 Transcript_22833/m.63111 type:complete len:226 (+) Transcript_22833:3-680(+)